MRYLIYHAEGDDYFEVFSEFERNKYCEIYCDDVTGIHHHEEEFKKRNNKERFMASEGRSVLCQGRIVWTCGDTPFKGAQKKDQNGKLIFNDKNEPLMQYGFGLAVPIPGPGATPEQTKNFMDLWQAMHEEAQALYPGGQIPPGFAMKYKDGTNGIDHKGQPFANRPGYKGCYVFGMTTTLPVNFFKYQGAYIQVNDGIKCGDYVQVSVSVKGHLPKPGSQGKPGLYLNPSLVLFLAEGEAIINAPAADTVFGSQAPKAVIDIVAPQAPAGFGQMAQAFQQPAQQAPAAPAWNGQANHGVLPPTFQQPAQQAPQAAPMGNWFTPTPWNK